MLSTAQVEPFGQDQSFVSTIVEIDDVELIVRLANPAREEWLTGLTVLTVADFAIDDSSQGGGVECPRLDVSAGYYVPQGTASRQDA